MCGTIDMLSLPIAYEYVHAAVSSQSDLPPESCPTLLQATAHPNTTCVLNNCTSLTCDLPLELELPGNLTFQVDKCQDPVGVVINVQTQDEVISQRFTRNGLLPLIGERAVSVVISRNGTVLNLQVVRSGGLS